MDGSWSRLRRAGIVNRAPAMVQPNDDRPSLEEVLADIDRDELDDVRNMNHQDSIEEVN